jgi:hypothetical protein
MTQIERAGGIAALVQTVLILATLGIAVAGPGIIDAAVPSDGAAGGVGGALGPLRALELIKVLLAVAGLVLVLGLAERLRPAMPGALGLAVAAGAAGAILLLASAGVGAASLTFLTLLPQADATAGPVPTGMPDSVIFSAVNAVISGLSMAGVFATGGWALLAGWVGWRTGRLSTPLGVLLLLWGGAGMLSFVLPAFTFPTLSLSLLGSGWLAAVLLRPPAGAGGPHAPARVSPAPRG